MNTLLSILIAPFLIIGGWLGIADESSNIADYQPVPIENIDQESPLVAGSYPFVDQALEDREGDRLGAFNFVSSGRYTLAGSGIGLTDTSIELTSFKQPVSEVELTMTDFGSIGYATINPGSATKKEFVSFTGITQDGSTDKATLTGVTRGLGFVSPYTASSTLRQSHSGGTTLIISNPPQLYDQLATKQNDQTITGYWNVPTPLAGTNIANKDYVDGVVSGGAVTDEAIVVAGNAGETVATGTLVYFASDGEWYKTDLDLADTHRDTVIGLTQGAGTDGNAVSGGVLLRGLDSNQTGLTTGSNYFVSATAGELSTATSTNTLILGEAKSSTEIYFDPSTGETLIPSVSADNNFTGTNTFATTTNIGSFPAWQIGKNIAVLSSTGTSTFDVPSGVDKLYVQLVAGGGGGGSPDSANESASGGGAGGYSMEFVDVSATSTIQYFIGSGGSADTAGGRTTFGTIGFEFLTATGGQPGSDPAVTSAGGLGGVGSGGDINQNGAPGHGGDTTGSSGGNGGASFFGGGGVGGVSNGAGGNGLSYGAGGGGGHGTGNVAGSGADGVIIIIW